MIALADLRAAARLALAEGRDADALARAHEADIFGAPAGELGLTRGLVQARRGQYAAARLALDEAWQAATDPDTLSQIAEALRLAGDSGRAVAVALQLQAQGDLRPLRFVLRQPLADPAAELTGCLALSAAGDASQPWRARAEAASAALRALAQAQPPPVGVLLQLAALHAQQPLGAQLLNLAWAAGLASPTVQFALFGERLPSKPEPADAPQLAQRARGQP